MGEFGFLDVMSISVSNLRVTCPTNVFVDLMVDEGALWKQSSTVEPVVDDVTSWKYLDFTGKIPLSHFHADLLVIHVKQQGDNGELRNLAGSLSMGKLLDAPNGWTDMSGELHDDDGVTGCGEFSLRLRYRVEGYEPTPRAPPTPSKQEVDNQICEDTPRFGDWSEMVDADGNVYYYNVVTGEASWDKPAEADSAEAAAAADVPADEPVRHGDWIQLQDDSGNYYWYNEANGQSAWELPAEEPEYYSMPPSVAAPSTGIASASAGGYTIEL